MTQRTTLFRSFVRCVNGAYGLCRLGWRYNWAKLYFFWPYMIVSMILNTSETVSITPQPSHSHFCCWLVPIWTKLDSWAENGAYGLCQLGWWYNGAKLSFSWPYMIVSIIWNNSETVCITPQPCHSHFCCWLLPIWPKLGFWLKMELLSCTDLVSGTTVQSCIFPDLTW